MPQIMPVTDLQDMEEASLLCHRSREPVFLTKGGDGGRAVMGMEVYERMASFARLAWEFLDMEKETGGSPIDAGQAMAEMRRKYEDGLFR